MENEEIAMGSRIEEERGKEQEKQNKDYDRKM